MMRIYFLGIAGTYMAGLALLARQLGYHVRGADHGVYEPMRSQLAEAGITWDEGYTLSAIEAFAPDEIVCGNVMSRSHPCIEALLQKHYALISGPQWLWHHVLRHRQVLCVAGTHGKTTTASLLTHALQALDLKPGFLIGGISQTLGKSADLGEGKYFVIEGDEYDSAFFDKRAKCVQTWPKGLILNNLEFDHADIFSSIEDIERQYRHTLQCLQPEAVVVTHVGQKRLLDLMAAAPWAQSIAVPSAMTATYHEGIPHSPITIQADFLRAQTLMSIHHHHEGWLETVSMPLLGQHNVDNVHAVLALIEGLGLPTQKAAAAMAHFKGVKRRLEKKGRWLGVEVFDDFAHHPTAMKAVLQSLHAQTQSAAIDVIVDLSSYTMCDGTHEKTLIPALHSARAVYFYASRPLRFDLQAHMQEHPHAFFEQDAEALVIKIKRVWQETGAANLLCYMGNKNSTALIESMQREGSFVAEGHTVGA